MHLSSEEISARCWKWITDYEAEPTGKNEHYFEIAKPRKTDVAEEAFSRRYRYRGPELSKELYTKMGWYKEYLKTRGVWKTPEPGSRKETGEPS